MTMLNLDKRRVAPLGGFSGKFLVIELRRRLRNRRSLIFMLLPAVFYFIFGNQTGVNSQDVKGYVMVSMATYGVMMATTTGGAAVSIERAQGWSRTLRLTPLKPVAYIATKMLSAMVMGMISLAVVYIVALSTGARIDAMHLVESALLTIICSSLFATLGLFLGYLLPAENVMQFSGLILAMLSMLGGLFIPLTQFNDTMQLVAKFTPAYGIGVIARAPLGLSAFDWWSVVNVAGWLAIFAIGAMMMFRRDTARV